jgi:DNA adenine methylase
VVQAHSFHTKPIAMKNTHHAPITELLIGRDLAWARRGRVSYEGLEEE